MGDFHNPYNFVPAPEPKPAEGLKQGPPPSHGWYDPERWSGRIDIRLTVETPLLLPDPSVCCEIDRPGGKKHKIFPVRVRNGKPWLAPTGLKGALRSAFEAITNSRFGVFTGHDRRLGYRNVTSFASDLVPAKVAGDCITLFMGANKQFNKNDHGIWSVGGPNRPLRWKAYDTAIPTTIAVEHQKQAYFVETTDTSGARLLGFASDLKPSAAFRRGEKNGTVYITNQNIKNKKCERVFFGQTISLKPSPQQWNNTCKNWNDLLRDYRDLHHNDLAKRRKRKADELGLSDPRRLSDAQIAEAYETYYHPGEPGDAAWSRHIYDAKAFPLFEKREDGSFGPTPQPFHCYARVRITEEHSVPTTTSCEVLGLYPVQISRDVAEKTPAALLPDTLKPAPERDQLSAADRVFGWVRQGRGKWPGAHRGQLRIRAVAYQEQRNFEPIDTPSHDGVVPLAILSSPKPQQARFYAAKTAEEPKAVDPRRPKREIQYCDGMGLRGRKIYPHHRLPQQLRGAYWDADGAVQDNGLQARFVRYRTANGRHVHLYREYRRRPENNNDQDDQNFSVKGWVREGAQFTASIEITNLSQEELGALLWLLHLPEGCFLRLGGGKPLGFGSVRVRVTGLKVEKGDERRARYKSLAAAAPARLDGPALTTAIRRHVDMFKKSIGEAYAGAAESFEQVSFIDAFLRASRGFDDGLPIHYPRARLKGTPDAQPVPPSPKGENFKWFVANEAESDGRVPGHPLPDLATDQGLPILRER